MTERQISNRLLKLKELERQQEELEHQAEEIRAEIKADMLARGTEEIKAGNFVVRLKEVITNRFDSKAFKESYKSLYEAYTKPQSTLRFTIS